MAKRLLRFLVLALATGFGLGLSPFAPGTFGSLLGPPLVWGLQRLGLPLPVYAAIAAGLIVAGGPICGAAARHFGKKDPGQVVYDEIVSFFLVFLPVPPGKLNLVTALAGFLWFRLFDITKPWPARRLEHLPGGWGILADDLAAGAYAGAALWVTMRVAEHFWPTLTSV